MSLIQIVMQREAAHETVGQLGKTGIVQFLDLAKGRDDHEGEKHAWQKKYINEIRRCEELESKISFFESLIGEVQDTHDDFEIELDLKKDYEFGVDDKAFHFEELESDLERKQNELKLLKSGIQKLYSEKARSVEYLHVLQNLDELFSNEQVNQDTLRYVVGVIPNAEINAFQMVLYRQTRGNMIFRTIPIEGQVYDGVDKDGKSLFTSKSVYCIILSAEKAREKVLKPCEIYSHIYQIPENVQSIMQKENENIAQYDDTIHNTDETFKSILKNVSTSLDVWKKYVTLEKSIYDTMNKFNYDVANSAVAEAWVPTKHLDLVAHAINQASQYAHTQIESHFEVIPTGSKPPTHFETTKFTQVFQDMTNAYAVPTYQEVNPAVITVITFPFLFAVMFGDFGHATILFLCSFSLVVFEKKLKDTFEANELLIMLYQGRYLLLMMSMFSIYTGLLYNDVFGISLDLFGTSYEFDHHTGRGTKVRGTYEFGVDPAWYETTNKLMYYNSVKMKMAIIFGVIHMMTGTVLKFLNMLHFRKYAFIFMVAIPELFILGCTFGYLCFMIVYKWCIDWVSLKAVAPDLLRTMTDFFLHFADEIKPALFGGQQPVQVTLLIVAAISVPVLLIATPVYEFVHHKCKKNSHEALVTAEHHHEDPHEEFILQEVVIHQLIHTIEFALGAVSNTASYLRLWALSLAHAQLSEVFFSLTVKLMLTIGGIIGLDSKHWLVMVIDYSAIPLVIAFSVWLGLTIGVLLGMESLSAFLHTLRLHWVEFNSKYYKGEGYAFEPLDFAGITKATVATLPDKDNKK